MINKVTCVSRVFTPGVQAQILYYVANNVSVRIDSIQVTSGIVKYGNNIVTCSQEWITVMNILNRASEYMKSCILKVLSRFSSKLLLMIDVVLSMRHCDIIFVLLMMIFDRLQCDHTYDVHTYINNNGAIESLLCYRKLYGFEWSIYGMSRGVINYVDKTHEICDYDRKYVETRNICGNNWVIDSERELYLITISKKDKLIVVGGVKDGVIVRVVYFVNFSLQEVDDNREFIDSQLKDYCAKGTKFYEFVKKELSVENVDVRSHHNIVNGLLC